MTKLPKLHTEAQVGAFEPFLAVAAGHEGTYLSQRLMLYIIKIA
jgi:hypothetical protein